MRHAMGRNIGQSFSTGKAKDRPGILLLISKHVLNKKVKFSIKNTTMSLCCHGIISAQRPPFILGPCLHHLKFSTNIMHHPSPSWTSQTLVQHWKQESVKAWRVSSNKHSKLQLFIKIISIFTADWKSFKSELRGKFRPGHAEDSEKEIH